MRRFANWVAGVDLASQAEDAFRLWQKRQRFAFASMADGCTALSIDTVRHSLHRWKRPGRWLEVTRIERTGR
jgi:hypothetical protein